MSLPSSPPRYASWADLVSPIARGEAGWRAYALQKALNSVRWIEIEHGHPAPFARIEPDGDFGPATFKVLAEAQGFLKLTADGVAGAATQKYLLTVLAERTHALVPAVPDGLMRGFAEAEGANVLAATNWSVAGGVDCGPVQQRVYGPPYSAEALLDAFDPMTTLMGAANDFADRARAFYDATWVRQQGAKRTELAMRTAVMAHNWPAGADAIAKTGICGSPTAAATWAPASTRFPDGTPVKTRWEWCQFYAMGGAHGEGSVTKYVRSWS